MNLRDRLTVNANEKNLDGLLGKPFEIDIHDFPLIYVLGWNYLKGKQKLIESQELNKVERKKISCTVGTDNSNDKRILIPYLFNHLEEAGVSESLLEDVKTVYNGIMFNSGGMGWRPYDFKWLGEKELSVVYPDYVEKNREFGTKYGPAYERIFQSSEHGKLVEVLDSLFGYNPEKGSGRLLSIQDRHDRGENRDEVVSACHDHLGMTNDNTISSVKLSGCHNLRSAYQHLSTLFKGRD
jgi:hypothetical protein